MFAIEITKHENGSHQYQTSGRLKLRIPDGWCVVPDAMLPLRNLPYGEVEAEEIDGVMTLTKWTAGEIPEPTEPTEPTEQDDINAMLVDHELRIIDLELGITEEE